METAGFRYPKGLNAPTSYFHDNGDRQFLTFGAGLRYNIVGVDISYLYTAEDESPLANTLRFSLLFNFQ
ncbi:hypothetical protein [Salinibacter ruber]|uniref:hypothetical protein n=1 Tax=Salinibacter ruber TaxID=146919 RepID=UPI002168FA75|nr:hypothetical protein [Salinibacter ruber]